MMFELGKTRQNFENPQEKIRILKNKKSEYPCIAVLYSFLNTHLLFSFAFLERYIIFGFFFRFLL
jgi:hypothetical protein